MSLLLICLIVTDTCNPLGFPFPIRITGDEFGCDLAEAVKSEVPHTHRNIDASDLRLWKPNHFFPSSPSHDLASHVDYLRLNASRNERNAIQLDTTAPLNEYFLSDIPLPFVSFMLSFSCRHRNKCPIVTCNLYSRNRADMSLITTTAITRELQRNRQPRKVRESKR
ncbi:hypothetical protein B0F90DRAFT_836705 [Multifurca ochricompacta]|uniref:Crinkler effector protein N-terminal domain-containing protein n=1 Tax=Multifurca ochricompacta TaxID=376703 RepID=A0AAD4M365_9AGAM|nr:hypothetical protein B0F90DRAFT_836705 [Multifurca ochricompacta]